MAVRPPPITPAGKRTCKLASEEAFAAPVNCKAIRKSEALRMPRIRLFFRSIIVGLPAPEAIQI